MDYEIGTRIKEARLRKGITLKELGEEIGISESNMQKHETGNIKGLNTERLMKIANALNVNAAWLMGWEPEQERRFVEVSEMTDDEICKIEEYKQFLVQRREK